MRNINAVASIGISAEYDLLIQKCLTDAAGNVIYDDAGKPIPACALRHAHTQKNLITNTGMNWFGTGGTFISNTNGFGGHCRVGGGSTEPAYTDTALVSQVASVQGPDATFAWGTGGDINSVVTTRTYTYGVGVAAGNLTEIGMGNSASDNLLTRSIFKDSGGNPITIVVAADEQLIVNYRVIFKPDTTDKVFNPPPTSPTPTSYTLTLRPANLGSGQINLGTSDRFGAGTSSYNQRIYIGASSGIGPITGIPTGTGSAYAAAVSFGAYSAGTFERTGTYTIGTTAGNLAEIGALLFAQSVPFEWQLGISPRLTKVNPETIKITILNKWSRA